MKILQLLCSFSVGPILLTACHEETPELFEDYPIPVTSSKFIQDFDFNPLPKVSEITEQTPWIIKTADGSGSHSEGWEFATSTREGRCVFEYLGSADAIPTKKLVSLIKAQFQESSVPPLDWLIEGDYPNFISSAYSFTEGISRRNGDIQLIIIPDLDRKTVTTFYTLKERTSLVQ